MIKENLFNQNLMNYYAKIKYAAKEIGILFKSDKGQEANSLKEEFTY